MNSPADNATLNNRNVTFSWNALSGCTFNGYTLRVCTSSNVDNLSNCQGTGLIDTGVGGTSYSYEITGRDNTDLWWGVRAANAPNGAAWAVRKFRIEPGSSCPQSGGVILYWNNNYNCSNGSGDAGYRQRTSAGWQNVNDGQFNDQASSVKVQSGWSVKLFADADRNGPSVCYSGDVSDFGAQGNFPGSSTPINDQVSSMQVYSSGNCDGGSPGVPTPLSPAHDAVLNRNDAVSFSWSTASNATRYYAEVWGGPGINNNSGWTTGTTWNVGQMWGGSYQWRVKSGNSSAESGWSSTRTFTVKYGAPSNLSAAVASSSQINLSWNASADAPGNIDGYRIYRDGSEIATVGSSTTTYQNTGLICGASYSYTVRAYKGSVESDSSNPAGATPAPCPPPTPTNFRVTGTTANTVSLAWDNVAGETGYKIYLWGVVNDLWSFYYLASVGSNTTAFTHTGLDCASDYYYEVSAYNDHGESAHHSWVKGTTTACAGPGNDDFSHAIGVTTAPYANTQSTLNATTASDDPVFACLGNQGSASVWYRYTPTTGGIVSVDTEGSDYDTVLAVWSGARGNLISVACDDDSGSGTSSSLSAELVGGATYFIEIAQYGTGALKPTIERTPLIDAGGQLTLNVGFTPTKPDLTFFTPPGYDGPVVPSSLMGTTTVGELYASKLTYFDAYIKNIGAADAIGPFDVELWIDSQRVSNATFARLDRGIDAGWDDWDSTVNSPGAHIVKLVIDPANAVAEADESNNIWLQTFTWRPVTGWWGEYFNNETLSGAPALVRDDAAIDFDWAYDSPGPGINPDPFSVRWTREISFAAGTYDFWLTHDDGMRFWIDDTLVLDEWDSCCRTDQLTASLAAGDHTLRVEMYDHYGIATAQVSWTRRQVGNDDIDSATTILSLPYINQQSTAAATTVSDDPVFQCGSQDQGSASVWYTFTPGVNGIFSASTDGSNYDTMIAVWSGSRGSLHSIGCNDDSGGSITSFLSVELTANTTYYLEIADYGFEGAALSPKTWPAEDGDALNGGGALYLSAEFAPQPSVAFYLSATGAGNAGGKSFTAADILSYTKATNTWDILYDGSYVKTPKNVGAFAFDGGDILLGFSAAQAITGLGTAAPQDLVRFSPTSLGYNNTAGAFAWFFDGSDVGLTTAAEAIDALWIDGAGRLYLSTTGTGEVLTNPAVPTSAKIKFQDEDVLRFTPTGAGATTAGTWSLYWDPTAVTGMSAEDINGYWEDPATGHRYVTILGAFTVGNAAYGGKFTGNGKTILRFAPNAAAPGGWAPVEKVTWLAAGATFPSNLDGIEMAR